jgi:hypothetical protein
MCFDEFSSFFPSVDRRRKLRPVSYRRAKTIHRSRSKLLDDQSTHALFPSARLSPAQAPHEKEARGILEGPFGPD